MDEDALDIERFRGGDKAAFDRLVTRYRREIYHLALRMLKNAEDAEEIAQQAFINAFNALDRFKGDAAFRTWLYRIAMNLANSKLRGAPKDTLPVEDHRLGSLPDDAASPHEQALYKETMRETAAALRELGEKQREVVALRIFQELPYEEIGRITGCSAATAKVHFHYGIENLRKKMRKNELL